MSHAETLPQRLFLLSPVLLGPPGPLRWIILQASYTQVRAVDKDWSATRQSFDHALVRSDSHEGNQKKSSQLDESSPSADNCRRTNPTKDQAPSDARHAIYTSTSLPPLMLPAPANTRPRRSVLVVSLDWDPASNTKYKHLIESLAAHMYFEQAIVAGQISFYLDSPDLVPNVVLITDAGFFRRNSEHAAEILLRLRVFVMEGGTLILASDFGRAPIGQMNAFFKSLGLEWKAGAVDKKRAFLEPSVAENIPRSLRDQMCAVYLPEAMFLEGVDRKNRLYIPVEDVLDDGEGPHLCPVAWESVGKGWVGFVGDLRGNENSWRIVLAMCGL